jgi:septal ring factor EnvC (AmiA/AmiB activator)
MRRSALGLLIAIGCAAGTAAAGTGDAQTPDHAARMRSMQEEMVRLRGEMESLSRREKGLLGEVARLGALLNLRRSEAEAAGFELEDVRVGIGDRRGRIEALELSQAERVRILAERLSALYKRGENAEIRRLLGGGSIEDYLGGLRYAALLSGRDARLLGTWREDGERLSAEISALAGEERRLLVAGTESARAREALERSRSERGRLLARIQVDRAKHEEAIADLERASLDLGRIVDTLGGSAQGAALDVRKFRGLLDWPSAGRVTAGFGNTVHPRFRTVVPHPGLDLDAPEGASFSAVFDGRVAFASWLHGYGLTAIVDHGHDVVSIYSHASILLVALGDEVTRTEILGKVGDTGSLRGAYLYFEMREAGKPTNPEEWLRRR